MLSGPPQLSEDEDVVEVLVERMDRAAITFLALVENDDRDSNGNLIVDLKTRLDVFKMVREWIVSRHRATDGEQDTDPGKGFAAYKNGNQTPPKDADGKFQKREIDPDAPPAQSQTKRGRKPTKGANSPRINGLAAKTNDAQALVDRMKALGYKPGQES